MKDIMNGELEPVLEGSVAAQPATEGNNVVGDMGPSGESVRVKIQRTPQAPTKEMVEAHGLTGHSVYRSWCPHCVRGRGHNAHHMAGSSTAGPGEYSELSFDSGFSGTKTPEESAVAEADCHRQSWLCMIPGPVESMPT